MRLASLFSISLVANAMVASVYKPQDSSVSGKLQFVSDASLLVSMAFRHFISIVRGLGPIGDQFYLECRS
jgi:hypothetical protein